MILATWCAREDTDLVLQESEGSHHSEKPGAVRAPLPVEEARRLAVLHELAILDTPPEQMFDDIAQLAVAICETPIALVSLVDAQRQWFKARVGLDAQETHRDLAFCAHAILHPDEVLVIGDAQADERFVHNDLVTGPPGIRFYAGAPIVVRGGEAMGTVCAIDQVPRTLTPQQHGAMLRLARQAARLLELRMVAHEASCELAGDPSAHRAAGAASAPGPAESTTSVEQLAARNLTQLHILHMISHDVREPVNTICNFSKLLQRRYGDVLGEEALQYLAFVYDGGARIRTMLDDLLALVRLDGTSVTRMRTSLRDLALAAVADLASMIERVGGEVVCEELPWASVDRTLLRLVLQNLISNGLKFARKGASPKVVISGGRDETHWCISVTDNGIGIAPQHHERLFAEFSRLHSRHEYEGTGLGLSICRRIAELHGGHLRLRSELGVGSTFTLMVPLQEGEAPGLPRGAGAQPC